MNSQQIRILISKPRLDEAALRATAEMVRDQLLDTYASSVERVLIATGLLTDVHKFDVKISSGAFVAPWLSYKYHAWVTADFHLEEMYSWADMTPIFELLEPKGFDIDKWTSEDDAASFSRRYKYCLQGGGNKSTHVQVIITCTLQGDNDTCKRVITGYTQPSIQPAQPIYSIKCGDDPIEPPKSYND